jgi:hypothetical protein
MKRILTYKDLQDLGASMFAEQLDEEIRRIRRENERDPFDTDMRKQREHRISYAAHLKQKVLELPFSKSIFISYSRTGQEMCQLAGDFFEEEGYEIIRWNTKDTGSQIPENILRGIERARFFLAIWSRHYDVKEVEGRDLQGSKNASGQGWLPSPWMYYELGAAMALGKPYYIFWLPDPEESPHKDVFEKIVPNFNKPRLTVSTFKAGLKEAHESFQEILNKAQPFSRG